ncbi:HAD family hydrolase [Paenibacillus harenae]|uniref:Hydrolase of the HAD superfamily n=1 Tax=Paenibacillus harenae TaxID=306543 RepID=A0ABT9UAI6_PAEHA|nr:HAD-IA family hydrolase [Paenibacillus harenae]MDQ0116277.1 putative hydrolase of the HAD superfamily [Paenibacillus harenae]
MSVEAVLFDLDNTLLNRRLAFRRFTERLIDNYMIVDREADKSLIIDEIRMADRDGYRGKRELYSELHTTYRWKEGVTPESLLSYWFSEFYRCTVLMDGAVDTLSLVRSKGLKLGLITNGSAHSQNAKIDFAGIRDYFDAIIVSDEVHVKKPDPAIFAIAMQRLGVKPSDAIYVGDHPVNDVLGARRAGLRSVWFRGDEPWDERLEKGEPTLIHLSEIRNIINK